MRVSGKAGISPGRCSWFVSILFLFSLSWCLPAQENPAPSFDPLSFLGETPDKLVGLLGTPEEVFPFRGDEPREDNVVFYYPHHVYFFFFENRVWQVRMDRRFQGTVVNLKMGMEEREVLTTLGNPLYRDERSVLFRVSGGEFPLKVRLFFEYGKLSDCYVFRGDF